MLKHITFILFKAIKSAEEHIRLVQQERAHYRECLGTRSTNVKASFPVVPSPRSCLPANSTETSIHYSFDMAQQVCIHRHKLGKEEASKSHSISNLFYHIFVMLIFIPKIQLGLI